MAQFDLPLEQLRTYRGELDEPDDFDAFWHETLVGQARPSVEVTPYPTPWKLVDTYDVTFSGFGGAPIKAWLTVPAGTNSPLPTVVLYHGYTRGRSFAHTAQTWALAGYAQLTMDTRGQGWGDGGPTPATADPDLAAGTAHTPGLLTAGILDPQTSYYRRVFTDAVTLLQAATALEVVDANRMIVTGGSQGGGITIAAAGLAPQLGIRLLASAPDVPFLCAFPRAVQLTDAYPYNEITHYLASWRDHAAQVYRTLSYVDCALLGERADAPTHFSVALMDDVCPPSTVFAAYNRYGRRAAPDVAREITVYPHNRHEGGGEYQTMIKADFFAATFAAAR